MTSDWPQVTIEEITSKLGDGLHGTPKYSKNGDYHFINGNNLCGGRITFDHKTKRCDVEAYEKHQKPLGNRTILVSINGTLGNVAYYNNEKVILGKSACYFNLKEGIEKRFVGYVVSGPIFQKYLEQIATGTTIKNVSLKSMREFSFKLPPLNIQRTIASVLGALDDKIENNMQMNETLEEMARAIFKSWFVDFNPVHAKAAGNAPAHMDAETAALFPSSFGDDGLPVGFILKTLKDEGVELESGKRPKGGIDKSLNEGVPSIGAESLQKIGDFEYSKVKFVGKEFAENSSKGWVQNYDVAIYKDGANVGDPKRVGLFGNGFPFDKFMVNEHVFLLRSKELGQPFLYSLCQSEKISHQLKSMGTSKAAQPGLNQQEVLSCEYVAPPKVLLAAFNKSVLPLINHRLNLGLENQTLTELRDTLLPKLMSGEIRIKDAEREVEVAV